MSEPLSPEAFGALFETFESTAFRLEVRDRYEVPEEREPLRRFLAGEKPDDAWFMDWYEEVRRLTGRGRRVERVRVVSEPPSPYARWLADLARRLNGPAGEDIRYLDRASASELGLPDEDYWLFDSRRAAVLRFDSEDRLLGAESVTDPGEVAERCRWRDAAWPHAVPLEKYVR